MYEAQENEGLGDLAFLRKTKRRLRKLRRRMRIKKLNKVARLVKKVNPLRPVLRVTKKITRPAAKLAKRIYRPIAKPIRSVTKVLNPVWAMKAKILASKKNRKRLTKAALYSTGTTAIPMLFKKVMSGGKFKTAVPRGKFARRGMIIGGTAAAAAAALYARNKSKKAKETSLLKSPEESPLVKKVGASPLTKSVVVNVSAPKSGGGMYRTAQPRDERGNVVRGKNDMIKKAAMIGIPAVLGVGALYMLTRKK